MRRALQALDTTHLELTRSVAAHKVALRDFFPYWCLRAADLQRVGTAWMEVTARGWISGVSELSL